MSRTFKDKSNIKHVGWKDRRHYYARGVNRKKLMEDHYRYFDRQ